ncbi:flagellar hook-length control protein FliK [Nitrosomonas ureae]|uniref:Flagellar hook-length control protein FliK n=1 Tax=Nitrosomonas ureae TaxID=44577 RepID=A0A286A6A5_9PROT|nr:flagellar hook-length control protein FliK [Nitrosomonas ureae]SOD17445.1 flagellar hook-length control protein FliK [Nitrosomonas ureae]
MLNLSVAPQINASAENNIAITSNSNPSGKNESDGEEFGKVLQREVSEAANKYEKNDTPTTNENERSDSPVSLEENNNNDNNTILTVPEPVTAGDTVSFIHTLLNNSTHPANLNHSQLPVDSIFDHPTKTVLPNMPQVSDTMFSNSLIPQEGKQTLSVMVPTANPMFQQKLAQHNLMANDYFSLPNNIWQSLSAENSAVDGNLLPFSSEMGLITQSAAQESIFSTQNESFTSQSLSSQSLGLNSTGAVNTAPQDIHVDLPINQPKWGSEFAQKVVWLTSQQNQVAEIHLNPAHLGPVEVMLTITQDQATAQFVSPHLAVREAIQEALPRLREMMADNGIQLGNVMVGADSFQQENKQQQSYQSEKNATNIPGQEAETGKHIETVTMPGRHLGMVNTYA